MAAVSTQRFHGKNGRLYVGLASSSADPSQVAYVSNFTIDMTTDKADVTAYGDRNKKAVAGLPNDNGSCDGFADLAGDALYTAARDGLTRKFYFYPDVVQAAGTYFFGSAFFDLNFTFPVGGGAAFTGTWNATSDIDRVLQS